MARFIQIGSGERPESEIVLAFEGKARDDIQVVLYVPGREPYLSLTPKAAVAKAIAYADARGSNAVYVVTASPEWWNDSVGRLEHPVSKRDWINLRAFRPLGG